MRNDLRILVTSNDPIFSLFRLEPCSFDVVVAFAAKSLVISSTSAFAWMGFYLLRFAERVLPLSVLSLLLRPPAAAWDLLQLFRSKPLVLWRRCPKIWHPRPVSFFLRQGLGLSHPELVHLWPDRLRTSRWLRRCRLEGGSDLIGLREGDRGVVLATLHFGPSEVLPYWLRAHGIVTTTIRGFAPDSRDSLTKYQYALSPPAGVPLFLHVNDMVPLPRFAHIRQLLGPGRRLLVEVDVDRGIQVNVPFDHHSIRVAAGAIRLAALAGAELIPCLIVDTGSWNYTIHFGAAVPGRYLANSPDLEAAAAHLLKEFRKVIARYPEQCNDTFLSSISPSARDEAPHVSYSSHVSEGR